MVPLRWIVVAIAFATMLVGWQLLWHFADDAFITYRYLSNAMLGRGLVWNPAPFLPVDGNTDFLWSLLLLGVWKFGGLEPPQIANWLTLAFGTVTFALLARALWRVELPERLERVRLPLFALGLALLVTNRGFLATLSSGLGIAAFNAWVFAWSLLACSRRTVASPQRWLWLGVLAGGCGISRPEGLLVVAATCGLAVMWSATAQPRRIGRGITMVLLAAVPVACQFVWRRTTTGDWMPCTYRAKTIEAWPESGVRYLASFVVEFGVYAWFALALVWLVRSVRSPGPFALLRRENLGAAAVAAVFGYHFAYYTFFMGGDLFEYRVYTHLIPWLPLSFVLMLRTVPLRAGVAVGWLATYLALAVPIGWIKYAVHDAAIAPHLPQPFAALLEPYDDWQLWMSLRAVCKRNDEMKVNFAVFRDGAPTREAGSRIPWDGYPVMAAEAVGVISWVLPNVAIIDQHGLNDAVVARSPVPTSEERLARRVAALRFNFSMFDRDHDGLVTVAEFEPWFSILRKNTGADAATRERAAAAEIARFDTDHDGKVGVDEWIASNRPHGDRYMAHEREAPPGYLEGFRPNVVIEGGNASVQPRAEPLTEAAIRAHELAFRERFGVPR